MSWELTQEPQPMRHHISIVPLNLFPGKVHPLATTNGIGTLRTPGLRTHFVMKIYIPTWVQGLLTQWRLIKIHPRLKDPAKEEAAELGLYPRPKDSKLAMCEGWELVSVVQL